MLAFKRDEHTAHREVMIEKVGLKNLTHINHYHLNIYDTVEVIVGTQKTVGLISCYSYRGGTKKTESSGRIIGYTNVKVIIGSNLLKIYSNASKSICDDVSKNKLVYVRPCSIVLIEKTLVEAYDKRWEDNRKEWIKKPIFGG